MSPGISTTGRSATYGPDCERPRYRVASERQPERLNVFHRTTINLNEQLTATVLCIPCVLPLRDRDSLVSWVVSMFSRYVKRYCFRTPILASRMQSLTTRLDGTELEAGEAAGTRTLSG